MYFQPPTVALVRLVYYRVTYEFALKAETWDLIALDAGSYYLDYTGIGAGGAPKIIPFTTVDGRPTIGLLDSETDPNKKGQKLGSGKNAKYLNFKVYRAVDFGPLAINLNLSLTAVRAKARAYTPGTDPSKTPVTPAT